MYKTHKIRTDDQYQAAIDFYALGYDDREVARRLNVHYGVNSISPDGCRKWRHTHQAEIDQRLHDALTRFIRTRGRKIPAQVKAA